MRNLYSMLLAVLFFSLLLFPLLAGGSGMDFLGGGTAPPPNTSEFKLKTESGIITLSAEDYITGVVAAEMPALYETEALKAQAVAAYTYALRCKQDSKEEWDLSSDSDLHQAYIDEAARREKWGDSAPIFEEKIRSAVRAVLGQRLLYEGEIIFAAYHAISAGKTEAAKNIWGKDYPYLREVDSAADKTHENYKSETVVSLADFCAKLKIDTPAETAAPAISCERSESGYVTSISVFGKTFSGAAVREALALRSTNFTAEYKENTFNFTVLGYGHGVGMSQFGANCLAKDGKTYKEILSHYYPGTEIA